MFGGKLCIAEHEIAMAAVCLGLLFPALAAAAEGGHQFDAKFRVVYFGDEGRATRLAARPIRIY